MRCGLLLIVCIALVGRSEAADPSRSLLSLDLGNSRLEGMALASSSSSLQLLARDGRLWSLGAAEAKKARTTTSSFHGYSAMEIRQQLMRELGKTFEVTTTNHYVVAHPLGQKDYWAAKFEDLYRHFINYVTVRGFRPTEPEFPLIAIVWHNQQEFLRDSQTDGSGATRNVLGYYSPKTNRITLYDAGDGSPQGDHMKQNADTIVHEATHQVAFNTGVHRRFGQAPRWLVEGLATMFEAPGVWHPEDHRRPEDRLNRGRLTQFKQLPNASKPGRLAEFISSDRVFDTDVNLAYANAWALSFFLAETHPSKYAEYLRRTAKRGAFQAYPAATRLADFVAVFGDNLPILETHFLRYISELK
jgi:uncharacterized protein DUF1570